MHPFFEPLKRLCGFMKRPSQSDPTGLREFMKHSPAEFVLSNPDRQHGPLCTVAAFEKSVYADTFGGSPERQWRWMIGATDLRDTETFTWDRDDEPGARARLVQCTSMEGGCRADALCRVVERMVYLGADLTAMHLRVLPDAPGGPSLRACVSIHRVGGDGPLAIKCTEPLK